MSKTEKIQMEKLVLLVKIIDCMEKLIIDLNNRTAPLRNSVSEMVKHSVEHRINKCLSEEYQKKMTYAMILQIGEYIYCVPEKRPEKKKKYINETYNLLKNENLEFLTLFYKELSEVHNLVF